MVTVGMLDLKHPNKNLKAYPFASVAKAGGIDFFALDPVTLIWSLKQYKASSMKTATGQ